MHIGCAFINCCRFCLLLGEIERALSPTDPEETPTDPDVSFTDLEDALQPPHTAEPGREDGHDADFVEVTVAGRLCIAKMSVAVVIPPLGEDAYVRISLLPSHGMFDFVCWLLFVFDLDFFVLQIMSHSPQGILKLSACIRRRILKIRSLTT